MGCKNSKDNVQSSPELVVQAATTTPEHNQDEELLHQGLVVAIDFGTACSGCAYSLGTTINTVHNTNYGKRPTRLCVDVSTGNLVEMGDKAYAKSQESPMYAVYERFKLMLGVEPVGKAAVAGQGLHPRSPGPSVMLVRELIVLVLQVLKDEVLEWLDKYDSTGRKVKPADAIWVVTVPISWSETAKKVMEEAAISAGLCDEVDSNVIIALEPEAALLGYFHRETVYDSSNLLPELEDSNRRFMVVDNGGGTYDICVVKIESVTPLRCSEVLPGIGGPKGATHVDAELLAFMRTFLGWSLYSIWESDPSEKVNLLKSWEEYKTTFFGDSDRQPAFRYSMAGLAGSDGFEMGVPGLIQSYEDDSWGDPADLREENTPENGGGQKYVLLIPASFSMGFFDAVQDCIMNAVEKTLIAAEKAGHPVTNVVLAGGFSNSLYLQQTIKHLVLATAPQAKVDIPHDPGMSILRGAVRYGQNPRMIRARALRYTYGIGIRRRIEDIPAHERNSIYCNAPVEGAFLTRIFDKIATRGDIVAVDEEPIAITLWTENRDSSDGCIQLYYSSLTNPRITNREHEVFPVEGAKVKVRRMTRNTNAKFKQRQVKVYVKFGLTRLQVSVYDGDDVSIVQATQPN